MKGVPLVPLPRYPWQALVEAMGVTDAAAARVLGISGSHLQEFRRRGMTERAAERQAVKAGFHPYEVWPEMADHDLARQREVALERQRVRMRRYRATKRGREANRQAIARYRASLSSAAVEAKRAKDREYRRARRAEINEKQRARDQANTAERNARRRERYAADALYRARVLEKQRARDRRKATECCDNEEAA